MMFGELKPKLSSACLLMSLPEDVIAVISHFLSLSDICNLSFCCKSLWDLVNSEKTWLVQCELVKVLPLSEIIQWRIGISSYKALCRFLVKVIKPLIGVWVNQNPELGNVVYVMSGFLSVVGCRIIPQEVGPLGIKEGLVMWSPVFEIICGLDGSAEFFLHGRDREGSCVYPGSVTSINKSCNELLLEVEPRREKKLCSEIEREALTKVLLGENKRGVPFCKFAFSDRRKLLKLVTSHVGVHVLEPSIGRLFPTSKYDERMLLERRTMFLKMNLDEDELCYNSIKVDINEMWENLSDDRESQIEVAVSPKKSFRRFLGIGIKHVLGKSSSSKNTPSSSEIKDSTKNTLPRSDSNRQSFLNSDDTFGLSLKASYTNMSSYKGWPIMPPEIYALYKLPIKSHMKNQKYTGLWGGTFGWQLGNSIEDKPRNALYLLMLSYGGPDEHIDHGTSDERHLIATKILEGTHYVEHPNGSTMFVVNIDKPSLEPFPFDTNGGCFQHSYTGEGIADGYGFRYPGSKPGSLYVISDDLLAFVWQETRDVFRLQRLNLEEILKKGLGLCVPPLPPTKNFTYMERSYGNVFTKSSSSSSSSSSE
ncbi:unnamed protein product [Thlaspi arvense]|uniref:F-box domain-containing protein n=1 Tax=Thlaspi arvense TaxID=13288 RepID=A0AAU9T3K0_THLAR|nr:unnamed protein product [Thlaspi arvense]